MVFSHFVFSLTYKQHLVVLFRKTISLIGVVVDHTQGVKCRIFASNCFIRQYFFNLQLTLKSNPIPWKRGKKRHHIRCSFINCHGTQGKPLLSDFLVNKYNDICLLLFFWHDPYRSRFESDLGKQGDRIRLAIIIKPWELICKNMYSRHNSWEIFDPTANCDTVLRLQDQLLPPSKWSTFPSVYYSFIYFNWFTDRMSAISRTRRTCES